MCVGYQINFWMFLTMQPGAIITCMLVTKSISRFVLIMQLGELITCMLVTKSISRNCLIMQPGEIITCMFGPIYALANFQFVL